MSNEQEVPEPVEEQTDSQTSDPSGPPQPVMKGDPMLDLISVGGVILVAAGAFLVPGYLCVGHTCGATQSAKIQWEERQRQVEQAIQEEQADSTVSVEMPDSKPPGDNVQ